jgi:hypothetical protein
LEHIRASYFIDSPTVSKGIAVSEEEVNRAINAANNLLV